MLKVPFGARCFTVTSDNDRFLNELKRSFLSIATGQQPDFLFNIGFLPDSAGMKRKNDLKPFWYGKTSGYFRWGQRRVDILFKDNEVIIRPFNFLPVFLTVFYFLERMEHGENKYNNVFFHAAGIIKDGKGYIFTGPSGSGKSTICEYSIPDSVVVNDELFLASEENRKYYLVHSPIKGKIYESVTVKPEIEAVFILKQDNKNYLTKLHGLESVMHLIPCLVFDECFGFLNEFEYFAERFKLACSISDHLPIYGLHFMKGSEFWNCIFSIQ